MSAYLSARIYNFRTKHNLSQDEFGYMVGVANSRPQGTVWAWESGSRPQPRYLANIRRVLKLKRIRREYYGI